MKRLFIFIVIATLALYCTSCEKDDVTTCTNIKTLTSGKWKVEDKMVSPNISKGRIDVSDILILESIKSRRLTAILPTAHEETDCVVTIVFNHI